MCKTMHDRERLQDMGARSNGAPPRPPLSAASSARDLTGGGGWAVTAVLAGALLSGLVLASCSAEESGSASSPDSSPGEEADPEYVSSFWVEREVRVRTLDRMLTENDPDEVVANIDDESMERLSDVGVVIQDGGGYRVILDEGEWRSHAVPTLNQLDQALANAMHPNEVTWCGETVDGEEFVDAYTDEFRDALDTYEEYEQSIADYVDCGTGEPG